jgi:hypothetical protein
LKFSQQDNTKILNRQDAEYAKIKFETTIKELHRTMNIQSTILALSLRALGVLAVNMHSV